MANSIDVLSPVGLLVLAATGVGGLLIGLALATQSEVPPATYR